MEVNDEIFSRAGACARRRCTCRDRRAGRGPLRAERLLSLLSPPLAMARRSRRRVLQFRATIQRALYAPLAVACRSIEYRQNTAPSGCALVGGQPGKPLTASAYETT